MKASKIKKMSTIPQLMANLSPESQLMQGLITLAFDHDEEERITNVVQEAMNNSNPSSTSLYPSLDEFLHDNSNIPKEKYETVKDLTNELFTDNNSVEYYVLTPIPDENAHEEFASSTDLLVLRWPIESIKPWESNRENVLDIDDLNTNKE
jgi:hypothetical protein